jgi:hypothetical protein
VTVINDVKLHQISALRLQSLGSTVCHGPFALCVLLCFFSIHRLCPITAVFTISCKNLLLGLY